MTNFSRRAFGALAAGTLVVAGGAGAIAQDLENTLYLDLSYGRVVIQLLPDVAPQTVCVSRLMIGLVQTAVNAPT